MSKNSSSLCFVNILKGVELDQLTRSSEVIGWWISGRINTTVTATLRSNHPGHWEAGRPNLYHFSLGSVVLFVDLLVQYSAELKRVCTPFWAVILFWLIIRNKGKASQRSQQPEPNHRDIWGWHSYQTWHIMVLLLCMLIGWLTGRGDGGDIITGYKAATHLTAGGRFPAIFPQEVRPSLPFFCEQNQLQLFFCGDKTGCFKGDLGTHPAIFVETKAYVSDKVNPSLTRLFFFFLRRPGDISSSSFSKQNCQTISSCFWVKMPIDPKETRGHFQTFLWRLKSALYVDHLHPFLWWQNQVFFKGHLVTLKQVGYFKPNHDVFLTLTRWSQCPALSRASAQNWT